MSLGLALSTTYGGYQGDGQYDPLYEWPSVIDPQTAEVIGMENSHTYNLIVNGFPLPANVQSEIDFSFATMTDDEKSFWEDHREGLALFTLANLQGWDSSKLNNALVTSGFATELQLFNTAQSSSASYGGLTDEQKITNVLADLRNTGNTLGLTISDEALSQLASDAVSNNWNSSMIVDELISRSDQSTFRPGDITANEIIINRVAGQYRVDLDDGEALSLSQRLASGELSDEGVLAYLAEKGKEQNPEYAALYESGVNINDFESNYNDVKILSSQLGISLTDEQITNLALNSVTNELTPSQLTNAVISAGDTTDLAAGDILGNKLIILGAAEANNVSLSDEEAIDLAIQFSRGEITETGIQSYINNQGMMQNPDYAEAISIGLDVDALQTQESAIADLGAQLGIPLTEDQIKDLSQQAVRGNMSEGQIADLVLGTVSSVNDIAAGTLTAQGAEIKRLASAYMVGLSDEQANQYALDIAKGEKTMSGLGSMFSTSVSSRYEFLQPVIDKGFTVRDFFTPQIEAVARTLEIGADTIDLSDPDMANYFIDESSGSPRALTTSETLRRARGSDDYWDTDNSRRAGAQIVSTLSRVFGVSGT